MTVDAWRDGAGNRDQSDRAAIEYENWMQDELALLVAPSRVLGPVVPTAF